MLSVLEFGFRPERPGGFSRALALCLALSGCGGERPPSPGEVSTWEIIRDDILAANCAGCHAAGTSFARQSGLVLTPDVAWEQLFNRVPNNQAAARDNLLLVSDQGLSGLYQSFLWEKINAPNEAHFYADHPFYGALMPPGGKPLTNGEIEFIRRWIVAGAPGEGAVADPALLEDEERWEALPFAPLAAAGPGHPAPPGAVSTSPPNTSASSSPTNPSTTTRTSSSAASRSPPATAAITSASTPCGRTSFPRLSPNPSSSATSATGAATSP